MKTEYTAAVIIIGNEILSGRTQDQNLKYLGLHLAKLGINLKLSLVIPDEEAVIIESINSSRKKYSYVFTTGGIGPTHDDITSASVAKAFCVPLLRNKEAVQLLEEYYPTGSINESRLKMADIPEGSNLIKNPVSGAPGFQIENVFVLPGVPLILQAMFEGITDRLTGGDPILSRSISTNLRESVIARDLSIIQEQHLNVSIGSYPYFKRGKLGVSLVMRSTNQVDLDDTFNDVSEMIDKLKGRKLEIN